MKKIVLVMALMLSALVASASETLYFTYNQSIRAVTLLNNEDELMIYCGYEDELPTYCLVNEVWAEQISSSFYEIWLHGYDAYTGEEIYMPIDMECIWLLRHGNIYSAAQTLRFRNSHPRPSFAWQMPPYNPWVRGPHPAKYYYSYHYDIHRPGWHYRHHPEMHYHPYYCRPMSHPAPLPHAPFTPGKNVPGYKVTKNGPNGEIGYEYIGTPNTSADRITASRSTTVVKNDPTKRSGNRITSSRSSNTVTTTDRISGRSSSAAAPTVNEGRGSSTSSRSSATSSDNSRSNSRATQSNTGRSSATGSDNSRSNSRATSSDNSRSSNGTSTGRTSTSTSSSSRSNSSATQSNSNGRSAASTSSSSNSRSSSATQSNTGRSSSTSTGRTSTSASSNSRGSSSATQSNSSSRSASAGTSTRKSDNSSTSNTRGTSSTSTRGTTNRR